VADRKRTALVTAGVAGAVVAGGLVGRAMLHRRHDEEVSLRLSRLPPDDLGSLVSFDGTELAVRAVGDPQAPPIVFVHGFSLDMTTWHEQWVALSERFRCICFDQRAHGKSAVPASGDLSLTALGNDLAAVIDHTSPGRPVAVVGHSMGAMSIVAMAEARPELFGPRVAGVVLAGAAAFDVVRGAVGSIGEMLRPRLGSLSRAAIRVDGLRRAVVAGRGDVGHVIARLTQFGPDAPSQLVDYVVGLAAAAPTSVWTDGLAGLMEMDLRHALRHIVVPALVVVGELDRVTPPSHAVELAGELPDGRLETIEDAGHLAMLERPDPFNHLVEAFAKEVLSR
jgi:pimeloyl-ACP methyl ester carboxylesterase